ncbi:hypothetical protein ELQ87_18425 [Streptomyces griseoviridis]|uniref:Uncharacterized protein n=2 Tax=Streptomyces griseoviridis TaxID=45398 RepID=A0A3S9ZE87_STRGD|nr:hypothetical protein [Streptomyces griseoviridis]AZS86035.1 hypothetical protein ELQ87_18425 [Streptomyces griseoviridis]
MSDVPRTAPARPAGRQVSAMAPYYTVAAFLVLVTVGVYVIHRLNAQESGRVVAHRSAGFLHGLRRLRRSRATGRPDDRATPPRP